MGRSTKYTPSLPAALLALGAAACGGAEASRRGAGEPQCEQRPRVAVLPCSDAELEHAVGVTEALGRMDASEPPEQLRVRGRIRSSGPTCTEQACTDDAPCCNSCSASLLLKGEPGQDPSVGDPAGDTLRLTATVDGTSLDCGGTNCGMCCSVDPLERMLVARLTRDGTRYLVANLCSVP